jgi:hypothetical protein
LKFTGANAGWVKSLENIDLVRKNEEDYRVEDIVKQAIRTFSTTAVEHRN